MRTKLGFLFILAMAGVFSAQSPSPASGAAAQQEPRAYVYREIDGQKLQAFVFAPQGAASGKPTAAVLLFHGGGWVTGSADWTFDEARHFAASGLAAVAIDYRLSAGKVTPIEALDDTRAAFRWVRRHAAEFNLDPKRVAGYGVSAGGQLVAAAGVLDLPGDGIDGTSSKPDLLLLWSPVLDIADVEYYAKLLQGRGRNLDYSPVQHAGASTPPTCIVHGRKRRLRLASRSGGVPGSRRCRRGSLRAERLSGRGAPTDPEYCRPVGRARPGSQVSGGRNRAADRFPENAGLYY